LPRLLSTRNQGTGNRVSLALDMIRRGNEILNRLENPRSNGQSSASNARQFPEGSQQAETTSTSVPPEVVGAPESSQPESSTSESSAPQSQTDPDSVNVYVTIYLKYDYIILIIYLLTKKDIILIGVMKWMKLFQILLLLLLMLHIT